MIRSNFVDIVVSARTEQIAAVTPGPNRVALRFAAPSEGTYFVSSASGGRFVLHAGGQDLELTRELYGDLLDQGWAVTPKVGDLPTLISILISQQV